MEKYQYLKKYINGEVNYLINRFSTVLPEEISKAEKKIGFNFPDSLKDFWLKIGSGRLDNSINGINAFDYNNIIFGPGEIADIILLKEESDYILPEVVEYFDEGYIGERDIIFIDIADMSSFLVMKPYSDKPNAVYDMIGNIVEESFERFIWRLYYESPTFYLNVNKTEDSNSQ